VLINSVRCVFDVFMPLLAISHGRHSVFSLSMHPCYILNAVRDRDELIRDQKDKGQGHSKTTCSQISTLGGIFSTLLRIHRCISMKLIAITHYQIHMTLMTFEVKRSRSQITFSENAPFWRSLTDLRFTVEDR